MRKNMLRIKSAVFVLWHAKHMLIHILLGLMWAWALREFWMELNPQWIGFAVVGSLLPDVDHIIYFLTYGRNDDYTKHIRKLLGKHEWKSLVSYMESGHKHNTRLTFHNIYTVAALIFLCGVSLGYNWKIGVVVSGSMISHFLFDIVEDILVLGQINPNWHRFGRPASI